MHAYLRGDAAKDDAAYSVLLQQGFKMRAIKGAVAGLVDDDFTIQRLEFVDDVVPIFATDKQSSHRPLLADRRAHQFAAQQLCRMAVR
jgi:hypothetical protein